MITVSGRASHGDFSSGRVQFRLRRTFIANLAPTVQMLVVLETLLLLGSLRNRNPENPELGDPGTD